MDTLEIHIENDSDLLDDLNQINAVVIDSSDVSSGFIHSNLLEPFSVEEEKSPSLQSFDVFCDTSNINEQDASVFSLEDVSDGSLILVSDQNIKEEADSDLIKSEDATQAMEGQVVQLEDGTLGVLTFNPDLLCSDQMIKLPDGNLASLITSKLEMKDEAPTENDFIIVEMDDEDREEDMIFELDVEVEEQEKKKRGGGRKSATSHKSENSVCRECNKFFSSPHHMKVHLRIHSGVRPYKCPVQYCDKAFATQYSRKAHIRTHTGEKPYRCAHERCTKAFKTSGDLQKHVRTHTGERPFPCPALGCNRSFTTSNIRKVHIRTHTGEKPYVCDQAGCDKSFASATNYKNHMRIHSGEKPYVCQVLGCSKRFTEYSSLYKHTHVHSDIRPFICDECPRSYRQVCTLNSHRKSVHQPDNAARNKVTTVRSSIQSRSGESSVISPSSVSVGGNSVEKYFLMELTLD